MNEPQKTLSDEQLDLLVDGELNDAQQRELLRRFEEEPGAWRRCALAFLESQYWKKSLTSLCRAPESELPRGPATGIPATVVGVPAGGGPAAGGIVQPAPRRRSFVAWIRRSSGTTAAMAASFLVALVLGWMVMPRLRPEGSGPGTHEMAETVAPRAAAVPRDASSSPWQMVTFSVPDGQAGNRSIRVPAMQRDQIDENWLRSMPQAMPAEVLQALERTGHRVTESRQLLPVPLEDGRRMVVPVDQVDVHYVGNKAYQ